MSEYPRLVVNLRKIKENTRTIVQLAKRHGMSVAGVTKGVCGSPEVGKAMLEGGASFLADSRIENVKRLREAGINAPILLLRPPMISEVDDVVEYTDMSLNTELKTLRKLSEVALEQGTTHNVVLLVEMGERRDGICRNDLENFIDTATSYDGIEIKGLAMNLACLTGVIPTEDKIHEFDSIVNRIEDKFGIRFELISGGNSANIPLLLDEHPDSRINNLRIGEAILLGHDAVYRRRIPGTHSDAFVLEAEAIEVRRKPSLPQGQLGENAFGETPKFKNLGTIRRAILAVGRQDVDPEGLKSPDEVKILWSSSDHMVVYNIPRKSSVGDRFAFVIRSYGALLRAFTSPYVRKEFVH
ncbi:alanine/ornithine racemase family PLP-dependent enzyme [Thermococcus prieurii]